ncbi:MAG: helix-turn-helix transcriptional regulator [Bacteroidales bacterium]|nr:helix-turn-helix transcriptional regulator [Bacteroidales bacterium]MCI6645471.1 helix-turn-helix transcriptional regulator [Bacteroidales bacterium]MCI7661923.1 helix-turn-helix transcriptional regulator [Bacteroidales bacterium]
MKNSIRVERAVLRISQQELADRVGVSRQTINAIESCRYIPSGLVMMKIAFVFQKSVNDIFVLEDEDWK